MHLLIRGAMEEQATGEEHIKWNRMFRNRASRENQDLWYTVNGRMPQRKVNPLNKVPLPTKSQAWQIIRICTAEVLGTGLLSFVLVRVLLLRSNSTFTVPMALSLAIWLAGPVSGGHVNPAVSLAACLSRSLSIVYLPLYWLSQGLGSYAGSVAASAFFKAVSRNRTLVVAEVPQSELPGEQSTVVGVLVAAEFMASTLFCLMVLLSADPNRPEGWVCSGISTALMIGATALVLGTSFGDSLPCSMNPAGTFASNLARSDFSGSWIHFLIPFLGSMAAALIFNCILTSDAGFRRTVVCLLSPKFESSQTYRSEQSLYTMQQQL